MLETHTEVARNAAFFVCTQRDNYAQESGTRKGRGSYEALAFLGITILKGDIMEKEEKQKTVNVQCEIIEVETVLGFVENALYTASQEVYNDDQETGLELTAMSFILGNLKKQLYRISSSDITFDLNIPLPA